MLTNGLIDPKPLRDFLIERKTKVLDGERRSKGRLKERLSDQIQTIDAFLIYLTSAMEEKDMAGLKLRLEETPIPTAELKRKSREGEELRQILIEFAKQIPEGHSRKVLGLEGIKPDSLASKMWAMRERGVLPAHIVPLIQTETTIDEKTKKEHTEKNFYISHKTPAELAKMKRGKITTRMQNAGK